MVQEISMRLEARYYRLCAFRWGSDLDLVPDRDTARSNMASQNGSLASNMEHALYRDLKHAESYASARSSAPIRPLSPSSCNIT